MTGARHAERAFAGTLVLLAHALLLWAWRFAAAPPPRAAMQPEPTTMLRLIALPRAPALVLPEAAPTVPERRRPTARAAAAVPRLEQPTPAAAPPTPVEPAPITAIAAPAEPGASAPALDLHVPRAATAPAGRSMKDQMRDQMTSDPRSNSPRPTIESRIAAAGGSAAWTEERMDATRTRLRKNGQCIEVHVARNAQIDPWNQNFSPTPKAVKPEC